MNIDLRRTALILFVLAIGTTQFYTQSTTRNRPTRSIPDTVAKKKTEKIVRDYILRNPEIIREALTALEAKEAAGRSRIAATNLSSRRQEIFSATDDPSAGDPKGDVSIAVFFDYGCGYCRKSLPALNTLLAKDPSVRVVYKEFPILGPGSENAALAALAAGRQGKYVEFHNALLESKDLSDETIKSIADRLKLDHEMLVKDMKDPKLAAKIAKNRDLANALNINGTPAYIINEQIIPGAIDAASLTKVVESQRAKNKNKELAVILKK